MPYLIDGHNLIGQLPDISLDDPNDEAKLVQKLAGFVARKNTRCTVVFDNGNPGGRSRMSIHSVEVVFASERTTADNVMLERIQRESNPKMLTVVSSDNAVLSAARRRSMQTVTSTEFVQQLQPPPPRPRPGPDTAPDLKLSPREVDEWLTLFKERGKLPRKKS